MCTVLALSLWQPCFDIDNAQGAFSVRSGESPLSATSLKNCSVKATLDCQQPVVRIDDSLSPASLDSVVIAERDTRSEKYPSTSPINSVECLEADQVNFELHIDCFLFFLSFSLSLCFLSCNLSVFYK